MWLKIFCDGGARGNPGPAASAFVVYNEAGEIVGKKGKYLGETTNNVAEYRAVLEALTYLRENFPENRELVRFFLDSQLVVNQLSGLWKIKDNTLRELVFRVHELENGLAINYSYVPREKNQAADALVNTTLDEHLN